MGESGQEPPALKASRREIFHLIQEIFGPTLASHGFSPALLPEDQQPWDWFGCNFAFVNRPNQLLVVIHSWDIPDGLKSGTSVSLGRETAPIRPESTVALEDFLEIVRRSQPDGGHEAGIAELESAFASIPDRLPEGVTPTDYARKCLEYYLPALKYPAVVRFLSGAVSLAEWQVLVDRIRAEIHAARGAQL